MQLQEAPRRKRSEVKRWEARSHNGSSSN